MEKSFNRNIIYSMLLGLLVLVDSLVTVRIGSESNPILLWIMDAITLTLGEMMFWRTAVIWGLIYFLYKVGVQNKYIILMYTGLYAICALIMMW